MIAKAEGSAKVGGMGVGYKRCPEESSGEGRVLYPCQYLACDAVLQF